MSLPKQRQKAAMKPIVYKNVTPPPKETAPVAKSVETEPALVTEGKPAAKEKETLPFRRKGVYVR